MYVAVMMLALSTGLGLLAFQTSTTELQISSYAGNEAASMYLAESGVDKALSWIAHPGPSPDPVFFGSLAAPAAHCSGDRDKPDFQAPPSLLNDTISGPFSELREVGKIVDIRLYKPSNEQKGICVIESKAQTGAGAVKVVSVEITRSPLGPITAGAQGQGANEAGPIWVHWGMIRYAGAADLGRSIDEIPIKDPDAQPSAASYAGGDDRKDAWMEIHVEKNIVQPRSADRSNIYPNDPSVALDSFDVGALKEFARKYGSYYVISPDGKLEQANGVTGDFDEIFNVPGKDFGLVYVDRIPGYSGPEATPIRGGNYKGYFYIAGDVQIQGYQPGQTVQASAPPWKGHPPQPFTLSNMNLDGLLYVDGHVTLQGYFSIYGAAYARMGFTGPGARLLEIWYNNDFKSAAYAGLPSIIRLKGTWRSTPIPASDM